MFFSYDGLLILVISSNLLSFTVLILYHTLRGLSSVFFFRLRKSVFFTAAPCLSGRFIWLLSLRLSSFLFLNLDKSIITDFKWFVKLIFYLFSFFILIKTYVKNKQKLTEKLSNIWFLTLREGNVVLLSISSKEMTSSLLEQLYYTTFIKKMQ